jgi:hypothetical protein
VPIGSQPIGSQSSNGRSGRVAALQPVAGLDRQTAKILKISEKLSEKFCRNAKFKAKFKCYET